MNRRMLIIGLIVIAGGYILLSRRAAQSNPNSPPGGVMVLGTYLPVPTASLWNTTSVPNPPGSSGSPQTTVRGKPIIGAGPLGNY